MENENEPNDINNLPNHQHANVVCMIGENVSQSVINQLKQIALAHTIEVILITDSDVKLPTPVKNIPFDLITPPKKYIEPKKIGEPLHPWQTFYKSRGRNR